MRVRVLGAAAGGGLPQWNCGCERCRMCRRGDPHIRARTQDSIAVQAGGCAGWVLVHASPDVLRQIEATPDLHPRGRRHTPIEAIVLANGDLDHVLGLFCLRESQPLSIHATSAVRAGIVERNVIARTLDRFPGHTVWRDLPLGVEAPLLGPAGEATGLCVTAFPVPGKVPVHLAGDAPSAEDNVGLRLRERPGGPELLLMTAVARVPDEPIRAAVLLFDGTFWQDDELGCMGLGEATARDMAHVPIGGPEGSLARLAAADVPRRIYTHINNSNPILVEGSAERRAVLDAGWEIAEDGMEITL
jgi:pyrroloquinoline quinone biosynthesis protein B